MLAVCPQGRKARSWRSATLANLTFHAGKVYVITNKFHNNKEAHRMSKELNSLKVYFQDVADANRGARAAHFWIAVARYDQAIGIISILDDAESALKTNDPAKAVTLRKGLKDRFDRKKQRSMSLFRSDMENGHITTFEDLNAIEYQRYSELVSTVLKDLPPTQPA